MEVNKRTDFPLAATVFPSSFCSLFLFKEISHLYQLGIVVELLSCVPLFVTAWTVAHQAPLSMGFSRQEDWSGLPCSLPGHLLNPGIEPTSLIIYCIGRQDLYP